MIIVLKDKTAKQKIELPIFILSNEVDIIL